MIIRSKAVFSIALGLLCMGSSLVAQEVLESWYHQGSGSDFPTGIRSEEWYLTAPAAKPKTIVVAVMDSGVDIAHPDLKDNIWVNQDEIPSNQKDDDGNGYVDDIHGWNFIGGADGRNVINESLEITRQYALGKKKWENVATDRLSGKKKREYEQFLVLQELVETKRTNAIEQLAQVEETERILASALNAAKAELNGDSLDISRLERSVSEEVQIAARVLRSVEDQGMPVESIDWLLDLAAEQFKVEKEEAAKILNYSYNPDYNSREIVGDVYTDFENRSYGNNLVNGDFATHGTHVAGIIGAVRKNNLGMDGIADDVAIMGIKVVPDGDERDKDVANGIRYAVDKGAQVINMSFGKGYSPEKYLVDQSMKYAARHDVLLVLGAGNEGTDIDADPKFPNDTYQKKPFLGQKRAPNLISVGALSPDGGENAIAEFSNYGKNEVDVFAPGVYIYSTTPDSSYEYLSGTSMAAPVVSGMAALIRSRYPDLSAKQVKQVIVQSAKKIPGEVIQPGTFDKVSPNELSVSGGMVDVVAAMALASTLKGKAKKKSRSSETDYSPPKDKA